MTHPAVKSSATLSTGPSIHFEGSFTFSTGPLFEDISLRLCGREWNCLLGPSGVGKSTILRLILGLQTDGHFDGEITADDGAALTNRVSYMAQSDLLLPWLNVLENTCLGARLRGQTPDIERARSLLDRVGLGAHLDKRPASLSGGMRQRAALARTLMEDRDIVLLDEPFSALDAGTRADMQELAAKALWGKTVLLVTHDPAEAARLAHQIILLSAGGATTWPTPASPPIRDIHAPDTISCQAALLDHLRAGTAITNQTPPEDAQ
jgi:putative hydroxymethylpyrimidine transport system ATP-binding protein